MIGPLCLNFPYVDSAVSGHVEAPIEAGGLVLEYDLGAKFMLRRLTDHLRAKP